MHNFGYYVDDFDSVQSAVNACYYAGGGTVRFGAGDPPYDINELVVPYDTLRNLVTLSGEGSGQEKSPTVLKAANGALGIVLANTVDSGATWKINNLEVQGGVKGISIPNRPNGWSSGNVFENIVLRKQTWIGFENDCNMYGSRMQGVFAVPEYIAGSTGPDYWPDSTVGFLMRRDQNANLYLHIEARNCGLGAFIFDTSAGGAGGMSSLIAARLEGNWGPGLVAFCSTQEGDRELAQEILGPGVLPLLPSSYESQAHVTQLNGVGVSDSYFEKNCERGGVFGDIEIIGHLHDFGMYTTRFGPPSNPQKVGALGPLMLNVHGVARRIAIEICVGSTGIAIGGTKVLDQNHSSVTRFSAHNDVRTVGYEVTRDDYPEHYRRFFFYDNGEVAVVDIHESIVGSGS